MFDVRWEENAIAGLAAALDDAHPEDQQDMLAVLAHIEELLRQQAHRVGEAREGNNRFLINGPLAFTFEVDPDLPFVWVHRVWRVHHFDL